jgi:hypothetical protein
MRGAVRADVDTDPSQPRAHETREDGHGNEHRQSARRACERCHLQVGGSTSAPSQHEDDRARSADDTQNTGHPQPPEAARTRDCKDRRRAVGHVDLSCRGGPMLPSAIGPEPGRTIPLRVSGGITRGSQFATVRDRTSGADPGGSDRSSGTDPLLTRHPAPRETRRDFRPSRSASGGVGRPRG